MKTGLSIFHVIMIPYYRAKLSLFLRAINGLPDHTPLHLYLCNSLLCVSMFYGVRLPFSIPT